MQSRHFFRDSTGWGPSIESFQARNLRMLWLPPLENCSLGASGCSLAATRVDQSSFFGLPHAPFAHPAHTKKRIRKPPRTCQARNPDSGRGGDEGSAPCWHSPRAHIRAPRWPASAREPPQKTILRGRGRGKKGCRRLWVAQRHQRAAQKPNCAPVWQKHLTPHRGKTCKLHSGGLAGGLSKGLAGRLPSASEAPGPSTFIPTQAGPFSTCPCACAAGTRQSPRS